VTSTATQPHTCHGAIFCGAPRARAEADCPACTRQRTRPALINFVPYEDPADPMFPDYAEVSMLGQCPEHGLERVTDMHVSGGSDPTELYLFACGQVDPASFGPVD
jgi:hypothetical protein